MHLTEAFLNFSPTSRPSRPEATIPLNVGFLYASAYLDIFAYMCIPEQYISFFTIFKLYINKITCSPFATSGSVGVYLM